MTGRSHGRDHSRPLPASTEADLIELGDWVAGYLIAENQQPGAWFSWASYIPKPAAAREQVYTDAQRRQIA